MPPIRYDVTTKDKKLQTIRNLLTKAEAEGVTPEEAESLTNKAFELGERYQIDKALLIASGDSGPPEKTVNRWYDIPKSSRIQRMGLLNTVFQDAGCSALQVGKLRMHVFGFESDMDRAEMLWHSLVVQGEREVVRAWKIGYSSDRWPTFKRGFWAAYGNTINRRLSEAKRKMTKEFGTPGTDIVLRDRSVQVQQALSEVYPSIKTQRTRGTSSYSGHTAGREAGNRANLGGSEVGVNSGRKAIG